MRNAWTVAFAVTLLVWACTAPSRAAAEGDGEACVIAGHVTNAVTGQPVPGAALEIAGVALTASAGARGEFTIGPVPPGRHTVTGHAPGFDRASVVVEGCDPGGSLTVTLWPQPRRVEHVDVVGQLPRGSERTPGEAFALSGARITTLSGTMGDLGRTLRSVPAVAGTTDERNALVARGGNPLENGFFVDGMELPNASHLPDSGSTGGLYSLVDPWAVQSVEFVVGAFPAEFGGFLSSVTDITYREGSRERVQGQARFDIAMAAVEAEGPLAGRRGSWLASVRHADFTFLRDVISLDDKNPRWTDTHLKVVCDLSPRHSLSLLDVFSSDRQVEESDGGSRHERRHDDQNTVGLLWRASWSERLRSVTTVSHSWWRRRRSQEQLPPGDVYDWGDHRTTEWLAARSESTLSLGSSTLRFGADVRRYGHDVGYTVIPTGPGVVLLETGPWSYRTTESAGFLSGVAKPFRRLSTTLGVRVEHSSASGRTHLSPRASASLRIVGRLRLNGAAAVVHQPLPADFTAIVPRHLAQPDLRAEQWAVGLSWEGKGWRAGLEAYDKAYDSLPIDPGSPHRLILDREPFRDDGVPVDLTDDGTGRARGLELMLEGGVGRRLSAVLAARVGHDTYRDGQGRERDRLYDSRYGLTVAADWRPTGNWHLSTLFVLQDGTPYTPTNVPASLATGTWVRRGGLYNTLRYPDYASLNARVERRFALGRTTLAAFADCWNILGRRNVGAIDGWSPHGGDDVEYQMPRTPFVGLGVAF